LLGYACGPVVGYSLEGGFFLSSILGFKAKGGLGNGRRLLAESDSEVAQVVGVVVLVGRGTRS
jgi:hypothetical protein